MRGLWHLRCGISCKLIIEGSGAGGWVQVIKAGEHAYEESRVCHAVLEQKGRVQGIKQVPCACDVAFA